MTRTLFLLALGIALGLLAGVLLFSDDELALLIGLAWLA